MMKLEKVKGMLTVSLLEFFLEENIVSFFEGSGKGTEHYVSNSEVMRIYLFLWWQDSLMGHRKC